MDNGKHQVYEFGGFQLDPARQKLFRNGQPVSLTPKAFETLVFLVKNRDRTLLKDELMQAVWAGTFVEEGNLSQNIFLLRKALGDDRNGHSFIHTVPRRGYRFVAPVTETEAESITSQPGARDWEYWKQNSPFRSLTVFEEEDAWLFFGREAGTADLVNRVSRSAVVAVVGNSGSGKSSLLRAGLIPALREGRRVAPNGSNGIHVQECWRIAVFRPSAAPFDYLAEVLPGQLAPELSVKEQAEFIAECRAKLPAGGDSLRNAISALVLAANHNPAQAGHSRVLLVVDQFEELFTVTHNVAIRDRYIDSLLAAACLDGAVQVHLVLSLRADFFGHCLDHAALSTQLEASLFTLSAMKTEQMRETIEKRLQLAGGRAEPGLIDSLLEDVGAEPGNLALLEHALGQLWEQCGGPGCTFTNFAYREMGRLRGALGRHADAVLESLDKEQKHLAQKIFLELVHLGEGAQDTRRRVAKSELLALGEAAQVEEPLARLASSRLIAMGREGEETFVEVSHEALIREWPALRAWLAENREDLSLERRLEQAAEEWHSLNRDTGALLQGARLIHAEEWLARRDNDTSDLLRRYVLASVEARTDVMRREREAELRELRRQKETARRLRWFSYALGILLLVAASSAWFAYHQQVLEKSRAMAAQAEEMVSRDRGQALDLAIRSWQRAHTEEARLAVASSLPESLLTISGKDPVYRTVFSPDGTRILMAASESVKLLSADDGRVLAVLGAIGPIKHAVFSPDGRSIVTVGDDHMTRVWDGMTGGLLKVLAGHTGTVWRAAFSPDGKRIVTASLDHTARVWDSETGRSLTVLTGHSDSVLDAQFSPDGQKIVTTSQDRTARVWNSFNGALIRILNGHSDMLSNAQFSPDGLQIATASYDRTARIWNTADGRLLNVLKHDGPITKVVFSPDGRRVATASYDNTARLWDSNDGRLLAALKHDGPVQHLEFSADGRYVVTASFDHMARVWNSSEGRLLALLRGHTRELYHAAFSPSGEQIVTGSADHTARVWNLKAGRSTLMLHHDSAVMHAVFSPDGRFVATASSDNKARLWNAANGHLMSVLEGHMDRVLRVAVSFDCKRLATASMDGTGRIWDIRDGSLLTTLRGHTNWVGDIAFSPNGLKIVTASYDNTARLWDSSNGRLLAILQGHTQRVLAASFSTDGLRIITASGDHTARVWDSADGHLLFVLQGHSNDVPHAQFSPDNQHIVTASWDKTARVWSAKDGRLLATLEGHTAEVNDAVFSPDGQRILTASKDKTARLWSVDGHLLNTLQGHTDQVWDGQFSPNGQRFATISWDSTARVWNALDGRLLSTLNGHSYWVFQTVFSPDSKRVLTTGNDQTARIWEILTLDDIERILSK
jgi:WD40 repeat protein/DNA-binding winged helix-turn-helix (wHTH) protein